MTQDPESILRTAFEAVAAGDAPLLLELLDPEALERRRATHLQMAEALWRRERRGVITPEEFQRSIRSFLHVGSPEELRDIQIREHLQRSLDGLPLRRRSLQCDPLGHVLEAPDLAQVTFRLRWSVDGDPDPEIRIARLRLTGEGWRLLPAASEWVVPGLDNLLFPAEELR